MHRSTVSVGCAENADRTLAASWSFRNRAFAAAWLGSALLVGSVFVRPGAAADPAPNAAAPHSAEKDAKPPVFAAEDVEFFEKKVRPVLVEHCQSCHAGAEPKAGLRLDARGAVLSGGDSGPSAVPGDLDKSILIEAVRYSPDGYQMPPKGKLPPEQIAALEEWVKKGLPWPAGEEGKKVGGHGDQFAERAKHWSFQPLSSPQPPQVANQSWPRDPLDRFILQKLEAAPFAPAPEAEKAVWLRRVTFDLTGLPPTPEEIASFAADASPKAYETVVDRLLASPRYGERWGRHWLDLMRYAETFGHEFDFEIPHAYQYRDYVIRALNADLPYDQFVREHVAGDLLPTPRRGEGGRNESLIATGFFHLGEAKHSPVDVRQDECDRVDNQLDVFAKTFLGLTVTCARCHDHKFDPITAKDYYALAGFLQSSRYQKAFLDDPAPRKTLLAEVAAHRNAAEAALRTVAAAELPGWKQENLGPWLAARAALRNDAPPPDSEAPADVVVADFEQDDYGDWKATGEAFGSRPNRAPTPEYQGHLGAVGKGFVNTHSALLGGDRKVGDQLTGRLTSPLFRLDRDYLRFWIGGGKHPDKIAVQLLVDGKVVRSATGFDDNRMRPVEFDLADLRGKQARLELVDEATGGWGNLGADQFVLTDLPLDPAEAKLRVFARLHGAKLEVVRRWKNALQEARDQAEHPLHPLMGFQPRMQDESLSEEGGRALTKHIQDHGYRAADAAAKCVSVARFHVGVPEGWSTTGDAWLSGGGLTGGEPPASGLAFGGGRFRWSADRGGWTGPATVDSGAASGRLKGYLRGPTFTIAHPKLWFLVAGKNAKIRLILESLQLIQNPIYGELAQQIQSSTPTWHGMDLSMWIGRRAYIELEDETDGWFALHEVQESGGPRPFSADYEWAHDFARRTRKKASAPRNSEAPPAAVDAAERKRKDDLHWDLVLFDAAATPLNAWSRGQIDEPSAAMWATPSEGASAPLAGIRRDAARILGWLVKYELVAPDAWNRPRADDSPLVAAARKAWTQETKQGDEVLAKLPSPQRASAFLDGPAENEVLLIRGSVKNLGPAVPRRFLEVFKSEPVESAGSGRLELAATMVDPARNPLLPRVVANRLWHLHFGAGIVRSPDDFGHMGQKPTHPELLDYLAQELIAGGWKLKPMHKRIVLSATYRMSSRVGPDESKDPLNLLWHRSPVRRLEAEAIRDAMLSVSGRLDERMFGPSVAPHLTPFMSGRGRPGHSGPLDGDGRRTIYLGVRRNFLNPLLLTFDFPQPITAIGRRSASNVPAQALALLNNPFVHAEGERFAARVRKEVPDGAKPADAAPARIARMHLLAFGREPTEVESKAGLDYLARRDGSPAAWNDYAHILFNVKEFIFLK